MMEDMPMSHMEQEPAQSQDLTLGLAALAGIFLAVVLVCALFFGFGYSTGRTLHAAKAATQTVPTIAATRTDTSAAEGVDGAQALASAPPLAPAQPGTKPSAETSYADKEPETLAEAPARSLAAPTTRLAEPNYASARMGASVRGTAALQETSRPAALHAAQAAGGVMVQIAAVVRPGDADALATALRKSGYQAVVRTEPQDKFLHVQVGPFVTREEARNMRTRLQADGYNAFMKP